MYGNLYPYYKSAGILSALKKINFSKILSGTQKTLNVVNQALPIVYQVKPIINNAKTVFKIIGAVKNDKPNNNEAIEKNSYNKTYKIQKDLLNENEEKININKLDNSNTPQFFI